METNKVTPTGIKYIEDFIDVSKPTIIYLSGAGQRGTDLNMLKRVPFYTKFYQENKGKYNFFIPQQTTASWSWVYPIRANGESYGVEFIRHIIKTYGLTIKPVLTGHSMGSPWAIAPLMIGELSGIAVVSGSGDYHKVLALKATNLPAIAYHGTADNTSPNDFIAGKKAAVSWYQIKPENWHELVGVGHGADTYAYASNSGLKEWIDGLFTIVVEPPPPVKDMIKSIYTYPNDSIYFEFESGKIVKV